MAWFVLFLAGLFEMGWALGLKASAGLTEKPLIAASTIVAMIISVILLGAAMRELPVGTAYAVWTGIGSIGTVILGIIIFGDSASIPRLLCIAMIAAGIAGLKFTDG